MELVDLAHALWRRRLLVSVGVVLALLLAGKTLTKARPEPTALATTRVLVDTSDSQLVKPDPDGMDSLIWRAHLLADQMTSAGNAAAIARRAGLRPADVRVQEPLLYASTVPTPLAVAAEEAASVVREPYVVTLQYAWNLPVIEIDTIAPDRSTAVRLAAAASDVIAQVPTTTPQQLRAAAATAYVTSAAQDGKLPAAQEVAQRYTARRAASIQAKLVPARSGRMKGLMAAAMLLLVWCIAVPLLPSRSRPRRRAAARPHTA